jgi:hypothetical protein
MQDGNSFLPWYNFPLIELLNSYIKPNINVFEYGCGFSTLFYAQNKCNVFAVEARTEWVDNITKLGYQHSLIDKINIKLCNPHEMPQQIVQYNMEFDIIVIDSLHRIECLKQAKKVYKKGMIILDNSERENLKEAEKIMYKFEYKVFEGEGISREGTSQAKVFFKSA